MSARDRLDLQISTAAGVVLALVIAILMTLALVHWMACSQDANVAACFGAAVMPLKRVRPAWLDRALRRVVAGWVRWRLGSEESALEHMHVAALWLPREIEAQNERVGRLRLQLIDLTAVAANRGDA